MTAPSRFLAWLVLPLLALCSANLLADTVEGAPKALHLLDYIGADYPPTVEAGKVIDDSEYREQVEFLGVLQGWSPICRPSRRRPSWSRASPA